MKKPRPQRNGKERNPVGPVEDEKLKHVSGGFGGVDEPPNLGELLGG